MKISIQIESKCKGCGVPLDCENLGTLETFEAAKDYLAAFSEGEYDYCEDCESEREIVAANPGGITVEEKCGCRYNWNDKFVETYCFKHQVEHDEIENNAIRYLSRLAMDY